MNVTARLNNIRIAPRKMRLIANSVRGLSAARAQVTLSKLVSRGAEPFEKLLKSAVANAENNFGLSKDNLYIAKLTVDEGTRMTRWQPHAFGRATQIIRRMSKVTLVLDEVVEGVGRQEPVQASKDVVSVATTDENAIEPTEKETEAKIEEAKHVEEHLKVDEARKETALKSETKQRKNVVKRTYQRKSF